MRFFCTGRVIEWDSPQFEPTLQRMGKRRVEGARAIIDLQIWKVDCLPFTDPLIAKLYSRESIVCWKLMLAMYAVPNLLRLRSPAPHIARHTCGRPRATRYGIATNPQRQGDAGSLGLEEDREEQAAKVSGGMEFWQPGRLAWSGRREEGKGREALGDGFEGSRQEDHCAEGGVGMGICDGALRDLVVELGRYSLDKIAWSSKYDEFIM